MEKKVELTKNQLARLPQYLAFFKKCVDTGLKYINASIISTALSLSEEQVRKDIQVISSVSGVPNRGREIKKLIADIERVLGFNNTNNAVIVGCGHLGEAFMKYEGFLEYGLEILAGFDVASKKIGKIINGKKIYSMNNLEKIIMQLNVQIAIITVPSEEAQGVVDRLVNCGIKGIWNFANVHISAPDDVVIETVNLASSLAVLSHKLTDK